MKTQFYMILPSNSSMDVFPDNTTACYSTKLPQKINLKGSWEVGIAEIHFPRSFLHLREDEKEITVTSILDPLFRDKYENNELDITFKTVTIPYGIYSDLAEFLDRVNKALYGTHVIFRFSVEHNNTYVYAERTCNPEICDHEHSIKMSRAAWDILGFVEVKEYLSIQARPSVATRPANILNALPRQVYIYSDVCEPCIVGDVQASLLRIVPVTYKDYVFASNQYQIFAPINYMPVIRNSFRTITIDIRDHLGRVIPFMCGTSTVTLHFRQSNS